MRKWKKGTGILANNLFAIRWQLKIAPGYTLYLILSTIFNEILILVEHTYLVAYLVDCIERQRAFADVLKFLLPLAAVIILNNILGNVVGGYVAPKALAKMEKEIHLTLYQKAVSMEIEKYDNSEFYNDFVWAMQKAPGHITGAVDTFRALAGQVAAALAAGAFIIAADSVALLVAGLILAVSLFCQFMANRLRMRREEETLPYIRRRDYINRVYYLMDYVKDLKMSDMAGRLERDFTESTDKIASIAAKRGNGLIANEALLSGAQNLIYYGAYLSYLFYAALVQKKFGMGTLLAVFNSVNRVKNSIYTVTRRLPEFQEHSLYIEKLRTFLAAENRMADGEKPVPKTGSSQNAGTVPESGNSRNAQSVPKAGIHLRNVWFTYEGNTEPTLKNVSMDILPGEKAALVGFNGAGKSTLIKLLLRLYDVDQGSITYAGEDIRAYQLAEYRRQFGALFQDFEIFATDLGGNLTMSGEEPKEEQARIALKKAGFWERFLKMPKGYHTQLTKEFAPDGVELSGGEAQKLALARVLYADAPVIVLDEPSSALDPIAEYQLNRTITELAGDKTVIIISHRLSTTRFADKIFMLEQGEITEQGTHDSLLLQGGAYAKMFRLQAEKYR